MVQIRQTQFRRSQPNSPQRRPTSPLAKLYRPRRCPQRTNLAAAGGGAGHHATRVPQRRWAEHRRLRKAWRRLRQTLRRRATASLSRTGRPNRCTTDDDDAGLHARPCRAETGPIPPSPLRPPSKPRRHHRGIGPRHTQARITEDRATARAAATDRGKQDRQATTGPPQAVVPAAGVHEARIIDGREETATR